MYMKLQTIILQDNYQKENKIGVHINRSLYKHKQWAKQKIVHMKQMKKWK